MFKLFDALRNPTSAPKDHRTGIFQKTMQGMEHSTKDALKKVHITESAPVQQPSSLINNLRASMARSMQGILPGTKGDPFAKA